jgi:twitching motility protein PilI
MANRAAIRELQSRLAARLQAARAEGVSVAWLAVRCGTGNYLFPLVQAGEIFQLTALQKVPYCQPWFSGVLNLRGGLYGVVDLAAFIAGGVVPKRGEMALSDASVITFHTALDINSGLLVDALAGLRSAESFAQSSGPLPNSPPYFGNRYTEAGDSGAVWQEINLQSLAELPEFLNINA